jgi:enamine deaminase RidA (YjgF/YER057c/UK114 family)
VSIERFGSGAPWESLVGYSRVVAAGPFVEVAGTAAVRDGVVVGVGDAYEQTRVILELIGEALARAGADLTQVVRTRIWTTDCTRWEEIARAHLEVFADHRPVTLMAEVSRFIDPDMLVEIEATAYTG